MPLQQEESIVPRKEKWAFFTVNFANIPMMSLINYFLLIFYIKIAGLDPVVIGTLFIVSKVIDGLNDPISGFIIDRLPKRKLGRFRPYLIIGAILVSLNFVIMWLGPSLAQNMTVKIVIAYVSYLTFGFVFDLADIPLNSMIPVMSDKDKDRNSLSNIKGLAYILGSVVFVAPLYLFIDVFPSERFGYFTIIIIASIVVLVFSILGTLGIKERIKPMKKEKYVLKDIFKILRARPVFILFIDTLIADIGYAMTNAMNAIFFEYVLRRTDLFFFTVITYVVGILLGVAMAPSVIRRIGKKRAKILSALPGLISSAILFFVPSYNAITFVIIPLYTSFGVGIRQLLYYNIQADNMDYVEWENGFRAEGAVASLGSFITKAAGGIGSALAAYGLAIIGFVEGESLSTFTIQGFYWLTYAIPGIFSLISLIIWSIWYPLTKDVRRKMMNELIEQRNKYKRETS